MAIVVSHRMVFAAHLALLMGSILAAAASAYAAGVLFHTVFVLADIAAVGTQLPAQVWIETFLRNLYGMTFGAVVAPMAYSLLILSGFCVAMPAALLVNRLLAKARIKIPAALVCAVAGAMTIAVIIGTTSASIAEGVLLVGSRGTDGYVLQLCAGLLGGLVFRAVSTRTDSTGIPFAVAM